MEHCLLEEVRYTNNQTNDNENAYENWLSRPLTERESVGITVSYDMAWQKRSSGQKYDSPSGHAFIVG